MTDITGMHIATAPQLCRRFGVLHIFSRQPRCAHHHLASAGAITRLCHHVFIDNPQIDQRQRPAGLHPRRDIILLTRAQHRIAQHRTGLRQPVAGIDVDAACHRRLGKTARQGRPANDHLQPGEIGVRCFRRRQQHLQDGRHAMGEGRPLLGDQPQKLVRRVAPGIDLLDAEKRCRIGKSPGMDMEHRRDRHIDIAAMQPVRCFHGAEPGQNSHAMQNKLPVRIGHRLGIARRAGGVEGGGAGGLVKIRKTEAVTLFLHHRVIAGDEAEFGIRFHSRVIAKQDQPNLAFDMRHHLGKQRQKIGMDKDDIILGMIDGVGNLRRGQPDIHRVKHSPHHRHCEKRLEIAMRVPVHHSNHIARPNAMPGQTGGKAMKPAFECAIAVAHQPVTDDLDFRGDLQRRAQQAFDQKRKITRRKITRRKITWRKITWRTGSCHRVSPWSKDGISRAVTSASPPTGLR